MSVCDKIRDFAEAREPDAAVIRDGLTYGDVRAILGTDAVRLRELLEDALSMVDTTFHSDCEGCWNHGCIVCRKRRILLELEKKAEGAP